MSPAAALALPPWRHRHLLDVDRLSWPELETLMATADRFVAATADPAEKLDVLRGVNVTILFYEASTRTRVSFEVAAKKLGADVVSVTAAASSVTKGESLIDTVRTLEATGMRMLVMRHATSGAPYLVPAIFGGHVINGGDGWHAHPTQALLDLYTLRQALPATGKGKASWSLAGRKVAIVGDLLHSRVARSNLWTLTAAGADVWACAPGPLLSGFEAWAASGVAGRRFTVTTDVDAALRDADVVMTLRIQKERMAAGLLPSLREYAATYGITRARLAGAAPGVVVMHPGPMNEGVEIAPDVADGPASLITSQVRNGVAIRMAVLALLHSANGAGDARGTAS
jgi:aspartate carbamoyltransferase catalytic subunit